jgi:hypothetical protein
VQVNFFSNFGRYAIEIENNHSKIDYGVLFQEFLVGAFGTRVSMRACDISGINQLALSLLRTFTVGTFTKDK